MTQQTTDTEPAALEPVHRYASFGKGVPELVRHPKDGWTLAEPLPMGSGARKALRGLIRALCPPPPAPQLPDLEDRIEREMRIMVHYTPGFMGWGFKILLRFLDQAPRFLFKSVHRLHRLEPVRAREIFQVLVNSRIAPIRDAAAMVRSLVLATYFDQDEVHVALRYAPVPFMVERMALRRRLLAGEPEQPADLIPPMPGLKP